MTYIDLTWRAYLAGKLRPDELIALQAQARPVCACGQPSAPVRDLDAPLCVSCYAEREGVALPSGESAMRRGRR